MAILSVALTRCLASFSFSILFFQHNPLFIAPFKPKSHTARSWTHRHTHTAFSLTHVLAQTEAACLWIHSHKHIIAGPRSHWDHGRPQGHTLHTSMGFSFERNASALTSPFGLFGVGLKESEILLCMCVFSVFWIKTEGKHYLGSYLWSLTYSRDSLGAVGLKERCMYWDFRVLKNKLFPQKY